MKYLYTMIRVQKLESFLDFFINKMGPMEIQRKGVPEGRFTLVVLATEKAEPSLELSYKWDHKEPYTFRRNFGHVAYSVKLINQYCERLLKNDVQILRPPRDGKMAFIRSPDQISVEMLQEGDPLPPEEPWLSMSNEGER